MPVGSSLCRMKRFWTRVSERSCSSTKERVRFEPAEVKIGNKYDGYYEILAGLSPGERIVASASFLLDSESRLKEAMGAMAGMPGMDMGNTQTAAAQTTEKKVGDLVALS